MAYGKGAGQGPAVDLAQSLLCGEARIELRALGGHGPRPQCGHLLRSSRLQRTQVTTPGCKDFVIRPSARGQGSSAALAPAVRMRVERPVLCLNPHQILLMFCFNPARWGCRTFRQWINSRRHKDSLKQAFKTLTKPRRWKRIKTQGR